MPQGRHRHDPTCPTWAGAAAQTDPLACDSTRQPAAAAKPTPACPETPGGLRLQKQTPPPTRHAHSTPAARQRARPGLGTAAVSSGGYTVATLRVAATSGAGRDRGRCAYSLCPQSCMHIERGYSPRWQGVFQTPGRTADRSRTSGDPVSDDT